MSHLNFSLFVLKKINRLVALFERNFRFSKKVNIARYACNIECYFFFDFHTLWFKFSDCREPDYYCLIFNCNKRFERISTQQYPIVLLFKQSFAFFQNLKILLILWFFTETTVDSPDMSYVLKPPPSLNRPTPSAPQPDTPLPPRRRTVSFHSPPPNYSFVEATNAE